MVRSLLYLLKHSRLLKKSLTKRGHSKQAQKFREDLTLDSKQPKSIKAFVGRSPLADRVCHRNAALLVVSRTTGDGFGVKDGVSHMRRHDDLSRLHTATDHRLCHTRPRLASPTMIADGKINTTARSTSRSITASVKGLRADRRLVDLTVSNDLIVPLRPSQSLAHPHMPHHHPSLATSFRASTRLHRVNTSLQNH